MVVVVVVMVLVKMTSKDHQLFHLIVNHTLLCIGVLDRWVVVSHKVALKGNVIRNKFFCHNGAVVERVGEETIFIISYHHHHQHHYCPDWPANICKANAGRDGWQSK